MNRKCQLLAIVVLAGECACHAALVLSGTSYSQNFDGIGTGLPSEWSVYTGATSSSLGTATSFSTANPTTLWTATSAGFYNVASADGLTSSADSTQQRGSSDRAVGIKQTSTTGYDPGAAIVLQIQNTSGYGNFNLALEAQILNEQSRSTTWLIQYRIGDAGDFTTMGTFSDPGTWGSTSLSYNSSDLAGWNNCSSDIWFRIAAINSSTGSNYRDMFAIDDFSLNYSAVPEPTAWGIFSGISLLLLCGTRFWQQFQQGFVFC